MSNLLYVSILAGALGLAHAILFTQKRRPEDSPLPIATPHSRYLVGGCSSTNVRFRFCYTYVQLAKLIST